MIGCYISHVPAKHFKMVRYYSFLSHSKRGEVLPKVYKTLQIEERKKPEQPDFSRADEGIFAHGSVQMRPVWQLATFQQYTGRSTRHGVSGRKAAQHRKETLASGTGCRISAPEKWVAG